MKKLLFPIMIIFLLLCGCGEAAPEDVTETTQSTIPLDQLTEIGNSGYNCTISTEGTRSETTAVVTYTHQIFNPNNEAVCTLTAKLIGTYNTDENSASMTSISANISQAAKESVTVSEHLSGDTATIILYLNQMSVCHFQYRIYPDGTVDFL